LIKDGFKDQVLVVLIPVGKKQPDVSAFTQMEQN
jgi:hypothetical protein